VAGIPKSFLYDSAKRVVRMAWNSRAKADGPAEIALRLERV
jgi:hypothetical protein